MASVAETRFVAVDVGTSSVRAGVSDASGTLLAHATRPIDLYHPKENFAEQSSENIWVMTCECIREVLAKTGTPSYAVEGIAFDATCSLVALGENDEPVSLSPTGDPSHNIILWADHRSMKEAEEINETGDVALQYVGGKLSPEMQLPKLLWLKRNMPESYKKTTKFLDLADFLTYKATGVDQRSTCTLTCKWTYISCENRWSTELFKKLGVEELLTEHKIVSKDYPKIGKVGGKVSNVNNETMKQTNISTNATVAAGMIDAHTGAVGCLSGSEKELTETLVLICGTSNCHMSLSKTAAWVKGIWGPYWGVVLPNMFLSEGGQSAAGSLLDHTIQDSAYYSKLLREADETKLSVYQILNDEIFKWEKERNPEMIEQMVIGHPFPVPGMLTFQTHVLGYHHGNRSPRADPTLKGMISGLSLNRTKRDLCLRYLSAIQSICYGTRHIIEKMNDQGHQVKQIAMCGGTTKNPLMLREMANITGCNIHVISGEPTLLGGFRIAAVAANFYENVEKAMAEMPSSYRVTGVDLNTQRYHLYKYHIFLEMWRDQLKYRMMMDGHARGLLDLAVGNDVNQEDYDEKLAGGKMSLEELLTGIKKESFMNVAGFPDLLLKKTGKSVEALYEQLKKDVDKASR
jgi:FGGY-family pentulose kinase|eukprot:g4836.t1